MMEKSFKGDLNALSLPDVLEFLRVSRSTGVLTFKRERVKKSLYIKDGNVIFATSNLPEERLGDLLVTEGKISRTDYERSVDMLSSKKRQGKILVEIGALTPKELWEGVQHQIRFIVFSLFNWDVGTFFFTPGELPSKENITADVGISDLIVEGIRRIKDSRALLSKFPTREIILARIDYGIKERVKLEPFERHVLDLVDGHRTLDDICKESEIGESETFRVLYMLISIGYIKVKGRKSETATSAAEEFGEKEIRSILQRYNKMFSYLYRYMMREVGPIAEHVLNKYLMDIREANAGVLKGVSLKKDGTLDEATIAGNVQWMRGENRKEAMVSSLNEFLYSSILAVKRTLGPEHESQVIETLKELGPEV